MPRSNRCLGNSERDLAFVGFRPTTQAMATTRKTTAKRKILFFNMMTLDGCFAAADGGLDWHHVDQEFGEFANEQCSAQQILLFGRVTYEMMAGYWSSAAAVQGDPIVAGYMNRMPKIVCSRKLKQAAWANTRIVKDAVTEVTALKKKKGPDLIIFGSANLASSLTAHRLIDEYRIMVNPLVLGAGRPLFPKMQETLPLRLLRTRVFRSGNVLLTYQPQ